MGFASFQLGRHVCEELCISPMKLAELCHAGKLSAYRFEDRNQILASSQCNMKFKFSGNTIFTLAPSDGVGIIAISKKSIEDFDIYIDKKLNGSKVHDKSEHVVSRFNEAVFMASMMNTKLRLKNIREVEIGYCNKKYIAYYNRLVVSSPFQPTGIFKLYGSDQIFFEAVGKECDIDIEYIEMNDYSNCGIKKCIERICIKKIQDDYGNIKYILSEYNERVIKINTKIFITSLCCIEFDESRINYDRSYKYKCDSLRAYLQQYSADYFRKEDLSFSMPLKHEMDFFIFEYDDYKRRYHFLEDEDVSRKKFFSYIERLVFDAGEVKKVMEYDMVSSEIKQDPQRYMKERCLELEKNSNYDDDTLKVIRAYRMAVTGSSWKEIHKELWPHRSQDESANDRFVSGKLDKFKCIAETNKIPFIKAKALRDMKASEKEAIVKEMLKQHGSFYSVV